MPWQGRPLPFFLPETKERFEAGLREADLLDQQAASLLSQQVQQEQDRREAERLQGQAAQLRSFEGQRRLIDRLQQEELQRIADEGTVVHRNWPFHVPAACCWSEKRVVQWRDGRLFVCTLSRKEIWQPPVLTLVTEGIAVLTLEELHEIGLMP